MWGLPPAAIIPDELAVVDMEVQMEAQTTPPAVMSDELVAFRLRVKKASAAAVSGEYAALDS